MIYRKPGGASDYYRAGGSGYSTASGRSLRRILGHNMAAGLGFANGMTSAGGYARAGGDGTGGRVYATIEAVTVCGKSPGCRPNGRWVMDIQDIVFVG